MIREVEIFGGKSTVKCAKSLHDEVTGFIYNDVKPLVLRYEQPNDDNNIN